MILHWIIAALILANIAIGWSATSGLNAKPPDMAAFQWLQFHKSLGLVVLVLSLARLGWRFVSPPPPMAAQGWQKWAAHGLHALFYALMIGVPLVGVAIGNVKGIPNVFFGLFTVPALPFVPVEGYTSPLGNTLADLHGLVGFAWLGLIGLHVAAALKHHLIDRDDTLARMVPGLQPRRS